MKKKIWIIDDYLPMLEGLRIALELNYYEVEIVQDALNILDKNMNPDLLLVDYQMPGLNVDSVFKQVKNNPKLNPIPTILMSGHLHVEQLATLCGADDFIAKPFNFDELLNKIETLFSKEIQKII